jgi:amino acid adenylation domain-containing protein
MIEDVYSLSPLQEGLYYHWLNSPDSSAYLMQSSYRVRGDFNIPLLENSFKRIVNRHAAFRTFFTADFGDQILQVVKKESDYSFRYKNVSTDNEFSFEAFVAKERNKSFDLNNGPLIHFTVIEYGNDEYDFLLVYHHIIMDGWCAGIVIKEFFFIYNNLLVGAEPGLPQPYPYSKYINWLSGIDRKEALSYWKSYLEGYEPVRGLPKNDTGHENIIDARESIFRLNESERKSILNLCRKAGVTENTFIQVIWGIMLMKYSDVKDVVFGSVVSGRPSDLEGVEEMVGLFINTIPVRIQVTEDESFENLLKETQRKYAGGVNYHYSQLASIQAQSKITAGLFDHIVQFQNLPDTGFRDVQQQSSKVNSIVSVGTETSYGNNSFGLTCIVIPAENEISFVFKYNSNIYNTGLVNRIQRNLHKIICSILETPTISIMEIDCMDEEEMNLALKGFNKTADSSIVNETVVDMFKKQVLKTPDAIAVFYNNAVLTYKELHEKSNQTANYLNTRFSNDENMIGIMMDRSDTFIVTMLGILKSGRAYIPVDPAYPLSRKLHVIKDSGINILYTQTKYLPGTEECKLETLLVDVENNEVNNASKEHKALDIAGRMAYVIYTSGSTGHPKGCCLSHQNLSNYIQWANSFYFEKDIKPSFAFFTSISFDLTITSIYCTLTKGGQLTIYDQDTAINELLDMVFHQNNSVNCVKLTPSHIQLLKYMDAGGYSDITHAIIGGEEVTAEHVDILLKLNPSMKLFNEYGPTETTVGCTVKQLEKNTRVLIGKPISNTAVYILNSKLAPCQIGVAGEIYISGAGVAMGYWNSRELTLEKFTPDPFFQGNKMYRTGDLGRWLENGDIEFLGRIDDQLKIRGNRVEPGEVENALLTHPDIKTAICKVVNIKKTEKEIAAYFISDAILETSQLKSYLGKILPDYMIPAYFRQVNSFQVTVNGKIDKKALPDSFENGREASAEFISPATETEKTLAGIWSDILGIDKINLGVKDNFFSLGGHSLSVIQMISRINAVYSVRLSIQSIFDDPTIENISEQINFFADQHMIAGNTENLVEISFQQNAGN